MLRIGIPNPPTLIGRRPQRHMVLVATLDGGMAVVMPVMEKRYQRLQYLQHKMNAFLMHRAGLNPRAFRSVT